MERFYWRLVELARYFAIRNRSLASIPIQFVLKAVWCYRNNIHKSQEKRLENWFRWLKIGYPFEIEHELFWSYKFLPKKTPGTVKINFWAKIVNSKCGQMLVFFFFRANSNGSNAHESEQQCLAKMEIYQNHLTFKSWSPHQWNSMNIQRKCLMKMIKRSTEPKWSAFYRTWRWTKCSSVKRSQPVFRICISKSIIKIYSTKQKARVYVLAPALAHRHG